MSNNEFDILKRALPLPLLITLRYTKKFWSTQVTSMIIFYVFLAVKSDSDIRFSQTRLDFAVQEVGSFAFL